QVVQSPTTHRTRAQESAGMESTRGNRDGCPKIADRDRSEPGDKCAVPQLAIVIAAPTLDSSIIQHRTRVLLACRQPVPMRTRAFFAAEAGGSQRGSAESKSKC